MRAVRPYQLISLFTLLLSACDSTGVEIDGPDLLRPLFQTYCYQNTGCVQMTPMQYLDMQNAANTIRTDDPVCAEMKERLFALDQSDTFTYDWDDGSWGWSYSNQTVDMWIGNWNNWDELERTVRHEGYHLRHWYLYGSGGSETDANHYMNYCEI